MRKGKKLEYFTQNVELDIYDIALSNKVAKGSGGDV